MTRFATAGSRLMRMLQPCLTVAFCVLGVASHAQLVYDADTALSGPQDGAGAGWTTGNTNWWDGSTDIPWPNTSTSVATFGAGAGAAGAVAVGSVDANGIIFATPGSGSYTLSGGTITLAGTAPFIRADASATISSVLAGTAGLIKTGAGTLTLSGVNTYSGVTSLQAGGLIARIAVGESGLGTSSVRVAAGSTLTLQIANTTSTSATPSNLVSGSGNLDFVLTAGGSTRNVIPVAGFVNAFTGNIRLYTSTGATSADKWNASNGINSAASLSVSQGAQFFAAGATTFSGGITLVGTGNTENRGAVRLSSTLNGQVTLAGNTNIGGESGTITGTITNSVASTLSFSAASVGTATISGSIQNGVGITSLTQASLGTVAGAVPGVLTLSGTMSNTFTGLTSIQGGIMSLAKTSGAQALYGDGVAGTVDVLIGAAFVGQGTDTLRLAASNQIRDSVEISLSDTVLSVFTLVNGVTNSSDAIGSLASANAAASVELGTGTLTVRNGRSGVGAATTFAGIVSGAGNLVMDGGDSGVFTLSGANTYAGTTNVKGGTLALDYSASNTSKLGDASVLTLGTGALALSGATGSHVEVVGSTSVTGSASILRSGANTAQISLGALTLGAGSFLDVNTAGLATTSTANTGGLLPRVTLGGVLAMNDGSGNIVAYNAFTDVDRLGGNIANNAAAHVQIVEAGTAGSVSLSSAGVNTISTLTNNAAGGQTTVSIGTGNTLRLGTTGTITSSSTSQGLVITGGTLTAGGADGVAGELLFANYTASPTSVSSTIANNAGGLVSVTKAGSGQLILSGANTHTGGTLVSGGTLTVANTAALGASGAAVTLLGGRLQLGTDTAVSSKNVVMTGSATIELNRATSGAALTTTFGTLNTTAGDVTLTVEKGANVSTGTSTLVFNSTLSLSGRITTFDVGADAAVVLGGMAMSGAQNISMVKNGAGTLVLGSDNGSNFGTWDSGANTMLNVGTLDLRTIMGDSTQFRVNLTAQGGTTLRLTRDGDFNYLSSLVADGSMQIVADRVTSAATSTTHSLGGLTMGGGTLTITRGAGITGSAEGGVTFAGATTLTGNATFSTGASARLALNGAVTGVYGVTKTGAGTMVLGSAANTYSGRTEVQAGVLQVGSAGVGVSGTGSVTVQSGGTLAGTGVVQGNAFAAASGATVHAGDGTAQSSYGTLTFTPASGSGNFDFQAGSAVVLGLNPGGTSDKLVFNGTGANSLLLNANVTIGPATFTPTAEETFDLLDWTGLASSPTFGSQFTSDLQRDGSLDNGSAWDLPDISGSGFYWELASFTLNGTISIVAVPEPSRALLIFLGLLCVARRRLR